MKRIITQLKINDKSPIKRLFIYFPVTTFKIEYYITRGEGITTGYRDYVLVIKKLYLYYDMKLVTFGIDDQIN